MSYGWIIKPGQTDKKGPHAKRPRACRACGGMATIGDYCDSCRNYLQRQKARENKKHD